MAGICTTKQLCHLDKSAGNERFFTTLSKNYNSFQRDTSVQQKDEEKESRTMQSYLPWLGAYLAR